MKASTEKLLRNQSAAATAATDSSQALLTDNTLNMTTYVYETVPSKTGDKPRYFEIKQNMNAKPLMKHPETGEPIRRVVLGGFGVLSTEPAGGDPGSSCGPGCGCL